MMHGLNFIGKRLLVIGAGLAQVGGIRKAAELGCHVIVIDGNFSAPGFKYAQEYEPIDFSDKEKVVLFGKSCSIDGVVSFSCEAALPAVAAVAKTCKLPGLTSEQVQLVSNKYKLRQHCKSTGIPVPAFGQVLDLEQCRDVCLEVGFPCVVKPVDSSGSRGVTLVRNDDDVSAAYSRARAYATDGVLIEEFMEGPESSVEGFVLADGVSVVALSDKVRTSPPYLLDTDVIFPTRYSGKEVEAIKEMAIKIMSSVSVCPTPFHMEVLMTGKGPRLVEVGLRGPGFKVFSHIIPRVSGVDVLAATIALAFGQEVHFEPRNICASVLKFIAGRDGTIHSIHGVDEARAIEGVYEVELYVKPGEMAHCLRSGSDRLGHIMVFADTSEDAIDIADCAAEKIQVRYV
jgi:biotin carboxylase